MNRHLFIGLCAGVAIAMASFVATAALHIARVPVHEPGLFLYSMIPLLAVAIVLRLDFLFNVLVAVAMVYKARANAFRMAFLASTTALTLA